jgi:hypothetical protein
MDSPALGRSGEAPQAKWGDASHIFTLTNTSVTVKNAGGICCVIANLLCDGCCGAESPNLSRFAVRVRGSMKDAAVGTGAGASASEGRRFDCG